MFSRMLVAALVYSATALTTSPQSKALEPSGNPHAQDALTSLLDFHSPEDPTGAQIPNEYRDHVLLTEQRTIDFVKAFVNSFTMILVTEIGDKTFFIAALLSMRHAPGLVFAGAVAALAVMTVLGAIAGFVLPNVMPRQYTHWVAAALFTYFGCVLLKDAWDMYRKGEGEGASDELGEVEEELQETEHKDQQQAQGGKKKVISATNVLMSAFSLTFLAEWGDRSQIATIALAAAKDPVGVVIGAIIGHSLCTGAACIGGKLLAGSIPERTVVLAGGIGFILFAVHSALEV